VLEANRADHLVARRARAFPLVVLAHGSVDGVEQQP
jgi:hypothetical protein